MRRIRRNAFQVVWGYGIRHNLSTKRVNGSLASIVLNETGYFAHVTGDNTYNAVGWITLGVGRIGIAEVSTIDRGPLLAVRKELGA